MTLLDLHNTLYKLLNTLRITCNNQSKNYINNIQGRRKDCYYEQHRMVSNNEVT